MKQLRGKLWAKITAMILLLVFAATAVLSCVGVAFLAVGDVYIDGGAHLRESAYESLLYSRMSELMNYYESYVSNGERNGETESYLEAFQRMYSRDNTNLVYTILGEDGAVIATNDTGEAARYPTAFEATIDHYTTAGEADTESYSFPTPEQRDRFADDLVEEGEVDYNSDEWIDANGNVYYTLEVVQKPTTTEQETVTVQGAVAENLTAMDDFRRLDFWLELLLRLKDVAILLAALSVACCIALFVFLLCSAGHKEGVEGIYLCWLNRVPFDLTAAVLIVLGVFAAALTLELSYRGWIALIAIPCGCIVCLLLLMTLLMCFAAQAKAGKWWRNTLCWRLWHFLCRVCRAFWNTVTYPLRNLSGCWKVIVLLAGIMLAELLVAALGDNARWLIVFWFLERGLLLLGAALFVLSFRRVERGGQALASGDLGYQVDTAHMLPPFRQHADDLNAIGSGMQKAVAQQMKSERMKTELITNVSHDIKTPLTSIVNYVGLMKTLDLQDETAQGYLEVLDRQSNRLRKLTEDLVEASKASTGNLAATLERTDFHLLLQQAVGEYGDRLQELQLEPVLRLAEGEATIMADGKLLWRVFDNLMSNICKYSLSGTRVYLSTDIRDGRVTASFKNISRYALDISTDELMERFVRGDASRSTEGSGLGLSIAQSLTTLQGGSFQISIDGDLFRADVSFALTE